MKDHLRIVLYLILLLILSFWAVKPLFHPGFFPMHDDTQVARVYEMAKALSFGQFPVRWVGDLGYGFGYPLFNFYAPLPYYIGAIFNLLGFDALIATKNMFLIGIILSGVTMFFLLKYLFDDDSALLGSLLYIYAPYHSVEIYVRGAVGELYVWLFLPLVLLGFLKIMQFNYSSSPSINTRDKLESRSIINKSSRQARTIKQGIIIGSFGVAGVFLSHNIYGMITGYLIGISLIAYLTYSVIARLRSSRGNLLKIASYPLAMTNRVLFYLIFTIILGLGLSAFFTLPAFFEKNFTRVNELTSAGSNFNSHFIYLDQLWNSPWGFAGSAPGRLDGMSFMIGKVHLLLGLLSIPLVFVLYLRNKLNRIHFYLFTFIFSLFFISVFLMLEQSKFIWEVLPGFLFIQYPWRFLVITIFSLSIMIPIIFVPLKQKAKFVVGAGLVILTVWFNSRYFYPKEYLSVKAEDYTNIQTLRFDTSKISDEYLPNDFLIPTSLQEVGWQAINDNPNLRINNFSENPTDKVYDISVSNSYTTDTNITNFPGWQVRIDGKSMPFSSKNGRIDILLPVGRHKIEFNFGDTLLRRIANTISILALFLVVYIIVLRKRA